MHDDVFVFDAGFLEFGYAAVDQGGDDAGVPAGVDDADTEGGAYERDVSGGRETSHGLDRRCEYHRRFSLRLGLLLLWPLWASDLC